ncbi:MAG: hypothetical protein A2516_00025 [Alphaproteobacteria bacterium RIFOXYD12_FULL_60_8]|nr:MAG: hypothetical protein A2516_00025 [Alphaproteobacteria bacterium RIFOXYD12_FULL_60_8]
MAVSSLQVIQRSALEKGRVGEAFAGQEPSYRVMARGSTKVIGRLDNRAFGDVAIAVARAPCHNVALKNELSTLRTIAADIDAPRVVPLYSYQTVPMTPPMGTGFGAAPCSSYLMKWITGFHSKTGKAAFDTALAVLPSRQKRQAGEDLERLDHFLKTRRTIPDLQLLLEPMSGKLFIIDPGKIGLTGPNRKTHPYVERWRLTLRKGDATI